MIFLAEAFTRPAMMHTLGKVGFTQSYTYFTWRNTAAELREYLTELSGPPAAYMRPNFWPNTPDILHEFLQYGGPGAFKLRAVLASTMTPSWGIYSGYELCEHVAVRAGSEEYLDSEKYQYRPRDWAAHDAPVHRPVPDPAEPDPARAPGPAPAAQHRLPPRRRRHGALLQPTARGGLHSRRSRGPDHRRREPRRARGSGDDPPPGHAGARHGLGGHVRGARPAHRGEVRLGRARLRQARPVRQPRPRSPRLAYQQGGARWPASTSRVPV